MGDGDSAVKYYEESTEFLSKLPSKDLEVVISILVINIDVFDNYFTLQITC